MAIPQIYLFGSFEVKLAAATPTHFETASARALLAYLVFHRQQPQARERLATLLWGADAGVTGLTNLRSCVRRVRSALDELEATPTSLLYVERDSVQFNPQAEVWLDLQLFEERLLRVKMHAHRYLQSCPWCITQLTEAATLYRGPLLADLTLKSTGFEEWQGLQRERLHRLAMQVFYWLADYHQQQGAYTEAEQYARRQVELEPWNEEAHQQLMRILQASGQRSVALAQYKRCRQFLFDYLEVEPTPQTVALYTEIRSTPPATVRPAALSFAPPSSSGTLWAPSPAL